MNDTVPPHSHLSTQPTINNDSTPYTQQSVGETMNNLTAEPLSDDVVVGVNPLSSQQARMQELNLLKLKGITRRKSLHLSPDGGFADVNSFYSSQRSLKESRKQQQLESKEYLHKYQNNEVAARKWKSKSRRLSDASFSPPLSPSTSHDSQERRDSPERFSDIEDYMPTLPVLTLSVVESVSMKSENESDDSKGSNQDQSDEYHADNIEDEEEQEDKLNDLIIENEHRIGSQEETEAINEIIDGHVPTTEPSIEDAIVAESDFSESQEETEAINEIIDGHDPTTEPSIEDAIVAESDFSEVEQVIPSEPRIEEPPNEIVLTQDNYTQVEEEPIVTINVGVDIEMKVNDGNAKDTKKENDQIKRKTTNRGRKSLPRASSIHSRTRPPKSKVVDQIEPRQPRRRRQPTPQPRFKTIVSSSSSERDTSVDSTGSRRLRREPQSRNDSDLSSQSSLGSVEPQELKTRPRPVKSQNSIGSRSARTLHSRESQKSAITSNSAASRSSRGTKTTKSLKSRGSASSSSVVAEVPMYADLLEKGIRKNSKRNISDAAMCLEKWEPKAHGSLAGCERCLGFANRKEISAYHTNGHHHRIMMTRGGCCKSCKLFPRKNSQSASRMCQRCFHDTHMLKLW